MARFAVDIRLGMNGLFCLVAAVVMLLATDWIEGNRSYYEIVNIDGIDIPLSRRIASPMERGAEVMAAVLTLMSLACFAMLTIDVMARGLAAVCDHGRRGYDRLMGRPVMVVERKQ